MALVTTRQSTRLDAAVGLEISTEYGVLCMERDRPTYLA